MRTLDDIGNKHCSRCNVVLPLAYEYKMCSECQTYFRVRGRYYTHSKGLNQSYEENKSCGLYLGVYIAEQILSNYFNSMEKAPMHTKGYDFICGNGFKIDVKSSSRRLSNRGKKVWQFDLRRNQIADYFLLIAFSEREHLTPLHVWLVPSNLYRERQKIGISDNSKSLDRWKQYEKPIARVIEKCDLFKEVMP